MKTLQYFSPFVFFVISVSAYAAEYPQTYRSAYHLGRGDTGIASAKNEDAIFYNPAGLARGTGIYNRTILLAPMVEFSQSSKDVARKISSEGNSPIDTLLEQEGNPQHFGGNSFTGVLLRRAALGFFVNSSSTGMLYKDPNAGGLEAVNFESSSHTGLTLSLAETFLDNTLMLGMTGKYIYKAQASFYAAASDAENLDDIKTDDIAMLGSGFGGDFGAIWTPDQKLGLSFGLTLMDIGNTAFEPTEDTDLSASERPLKDNLQTVNFGVSYEPATKMSKFRLLADYVDILNNNKHSTFKRINIGGELTVKDFVGFTTGLHQGYPTFGFYADIRFLRLDLGLYTEEIGEKVGQRPDTRYFLRLICAI